MKILVLKHRSKPSVSDVNRVWKHRTKPSVSDEDNFENLGQNPVFPMKIVLKPRTKPSVSDEYGVWKQAKTQCFR